MKEFKKDNLREVINKMFEIAGYDFDYDRLLEYQKTNPNWFQEFTITKEKEDVFIDYLTKYLKPYTSESRLDKEVWTFMLNYWLKLSNENNTTNTLWDNLQEEKTKEDTSMT